MGASEWQAMGPWAGTVEQTLSDVQATFLRSAEVLEVLPDGDDLAAMGEDMLAMAESLPEIDIDELEAAIAGIDPDGRPASRDHAVLLCATNLGTGSVLDVDGVRPKAGRVDRPPPWQDEGLFATPLLSEELITRFGSIRPKIAAVESGAAALASALHRGASRYIVAYENDEPAFVMFVGASAD